MALLAGLTGSMGSGKSLAAEMLKELGAHIIDADEICRSLVEPGKPAWSEVTKLFGEKVLREDGALDRNKIAAIIFNDPGKRKAMENILHPKVFSEEQRIFESIRKREKDALVIVNAPLLIESGNYKKMDKVAVIFCDEEIQVRRIVERGVFSSEDARKRIKSQIGLKEKLKIADYILENDGDREELYKNVQTICKEIEDLASGKGPVSA